MIVYKKIIPLMKRFGMLVMFLSIHTTAYLQTLPELVDTSTISDVQPLLDLDPTYKLVFSDEFNDSILDTLKWHVSVSSKSRAPREKLSIDDWWWVSENVWEEDGDLVLEVTKKDYNTMHNGCVNSKNRYEPRYGYFETRIKIGEADKATHTAFWLTGEFQSRVDGTANDGAEIDVFESAWLSDYTKSVIHIDGYGSDHKANTKQFYVPELHTGYHTWGLHWTEDFLRIYYDGVFKVEYSGIWNVHLPEFLILSNGASFGIEGDYFTSQPLGTLTHTYVDYVRAWEEPYILQDTVNILMEAECNKSKSIHWFYHTDPSASGGYYIGVDPDLEDCPLEEADLNGLINYQIDIPAYEEYSIWMNVKFPSDTANSFWYGYDFEDWELFEDTINSEWHWVKVTDTWLPIGSQDFSIGYREKGVAIDRLFITSTKTNPSDILPDPIPGCIVDTTLNGSGKLIETPMVQILVNGDFSQGHYNGWEGTNLAMGSTQSSTPPYLRIMAQAGSLFQEVDVVGGFRYEFSFDARYWVPDTDPPESFYVLDAISGDTLASIMIKNKVEFTYHSVEFDAPANLQKIKLSVVKLESESPGLFFDNIKLMILPDTTAINIQADETSVMEGDSVLLVFSTDNTLYLDQWANLRVSGVDAEQYYISDTTIVIPVGKDSTALYFVARADAIEGDNETATVSFGEFARFISPGLQNSVQIQIIDNTVASSVHNNDLSGNNGSLSNRIYPNPCSDRLYVNFDKPTEAFLYDLKGRLLLSGIISKNGLDVHALHDGIYLIRLRTDEEVYMGKVVVAHHSR